MSEFHYIQMPPDGTGKKSSQLGIMEVKFTGGTQNPDGFQIGDVVTTVSGLEGSVVYVEGNWSAGEIYLRLNHGSTDSVSIGETLEVGAVAYGTVSVNSDIFYTQDINIVGHNNPFYGVSVDKSGAMYMRFAGGSMSYDAFGKLQSSQSTTIREYLPVYDILPDDFDHRVWNAGVLDTSFDSGNNGDNDIFFDSQASVVALQTGTSNGDRVRRRSHLYHKYQTGVATTIIFSAFLADSGKTGVVRDIGFYDDNDGVFFRANEDAPNGLECVVRHSVTGSVVEEVYEQTEWNRDRLNGASDSFNISGHALDPTKIQVMFIDFQWLGGGRIRYGFFIDGIPIVCHEVDNANNITRVWSRTGSLPLTMEQYNVSGGVVGNSVMYNVSSVIRCEGEYKPRQYLSSGSLPPAVSVGPNANGEDYTFIGAVRPVKYISYADDVTFNGTVTFNASSAGSPQTAGTITSAGDFVAAGFVNGDYIQIDGANKNNRIIYEVATVATNTLTLTTDSPPLYADGPVACTIVSKKKTPNRAIGEIKDITLMDVSGQNKPILVELIKNAGLVGSTNGLLTVDNIGGTITGYTDKELVDIDGGSGAGMGAVGQVTVSGGDVTAVNILVAGETYNVSDTGLTLTGRESSTATCTVDVLTTGAADFTWQDAYSGNMLDAAKPSTGVIGTTSQANTMYTTLMTGGHVKMDLREHFDRNTELMFRKAELDDAPDDWTIRVKTFNDSDTAQIAFAISWLEVRA